MGLRTFLIHLLGGVDGKIVAVTSPQSPRVGASGQPLNADGSCAECNHPRGEWNWHNPECAFVARNRVELEARDERQQEEPTGEKLYRPSRWRKRSDGTPLVSVLWKRFTGAIPIFKSENRPVASVPADNHTRPTMEADPNTPLPITDRPTEKTPQSIAPEVTKKERL